MATTVTLEVDVCFATRVVVGVAAVAVVAKVLACAWRRARLSSIAGRARAHRTAAVAGAAAVVPAPLTAENVAEQLQRLRKVFRTGRTQTVAWRMEQLSNLRDLLLENMEPLRQALKADLGRHAMESNNADLDIVVGELDYMLSNVERWARTRTIASNFVALPDSSHVRYDPLGVVCIMSPWNYPVNLALVPLAGAITAGNCCLVKLSRHSPNVSGLLFKLLPRYLGTECFTFEYEGGADMIKALIAQPFDHFFFTGSVNVGQVVYEGAAKHLSPCVLELGGKNPCIVEQSADLAQAAKKITWGKFFNAGQTCLAPDYVFVHKSQEQELLKHVVRFIKEFYGEDPSISPSFGRIISEQHTERLQGLFKDGEIVLGPSFGYRRIFSLLMDETIDLSFPSVHYVQ
eukprot:TRINITY_DN2003_c0_g1_i2.p1 TRINITY_DN2003_c0_g1~~TRINITY_DN2003_c0_g1_i2.p1  ORF type:complete len:449 (-),score=104.52 TRINITY_DN2003_c0_g1_i2:585-1793(-)